MHAHDRMGATQEGTRPEGDKGSKADKLISKNAGFPLTHRTWSLHLWSSGEDALRPTS
jgi:hypothetical protein